MNDHTKLTMMLMQRKSKANFWPVVDEIMKHLTYHPDPAVRQSMKDLVKAAKLERQSKNNKFGATEQKSLRHLGLMPEQLQLALDRLFPEGLPMGNKKFGHEFFRRYPKLRIAEVI
jgi:hypothetical protein